MKHVIALSGILVAVFGVGTSLDGNVTIGLPLVLVGLCSVGAAYAQLEGIGLALIVVGMDVGFYVGWWQAAILLVLGVTVAVKDPDPSTPLGIVLHS